MIAIHLSFPFITKANECSTYIKGVIRDGVKPTSVHKERRFNFEGRQDLNQINSDLGLARKKFLLDSYNPNNKYSLNRMDEVYFSGIADILDYRYRQDFPHLTDVQIQVKVSGELDELVRGCKGST